MSETATKLAPGLWRPDSKIVCVGCHTEEYGNDYGFMTKPTPIDLALYTARERGENEAKAHCDVCGKHIWLHESVAYEQAIVDALKKEGFEKASMSQTGGMCSAASLRVEMDEDRLDRWFWVTWAENDGPPLFYVMLTEYDLSSQEEEFEEEFNLTADKAIEWIKKKLEEIGHA